MAMRCLITYFFCSEKMQMALTVRLLSLICSSFLVSEFILAQSNDGKVAAGAYLTATAGNSSSSWLSPSGDFAFGFRQIESSDLFVLSVWYAKIPDRTIVWFASVDNPGDVTKGSVVNVTADSGLVLTSPQGVQLWKSDPISGVVSLGVLNDTGNFVLQDNSAQSLWETFSNLTDTILPGQDVEKGGKLWSQQSKTNFTKGRFRLILQDDGNLVLVTVNLPTEFSNSPYWGSGTNGDTNASTAGVKLVFNTSGYLYVLRQNGDKYNINDAVSASSFYLRATLNFDGVFALYSYPKSLASNGNWTLVWSVPDNICMVKFAGGVGVCGYNSVCTLQNQRPICKCPESFSLTNPSDPYGNCKADFVQGCEADEQQNATKDLYEVQVLTNTDWPTSDYVTLYHSTAESCNASCFGDCFCTVAVYRNETCWKKKLPLSNGRVDTSLNSQTFIKVRKGNLTLPFLQILKIRKDRTTLIRVGSALLGTSVFANIMLCVIVGLGFFFIYKKKQVSSNQLALDSNLRCFSYEELKGATNGFNEELGKGSFGVVYKGTLQIGSGVPVAVKKLNFVVQDSEKEFLTELNVIGQTHHKNLVRLVGYCEEGQERLLVYELLSNGTLANFLFGGTKPSWTQRIDIAYGVAKGLLYLHEECSTQIIHCDIKPQNILLDEYFNVRIADFGLAKLLMMNQSQTQTAIRGTKGYVAPEWFRNMSITTKVDVYSFGVVLLECICCRRSVYMENVSEDSAILTDWVYDCYLKGALDAVVNYEAEALHEKAQLERLIMVAIWCIQEDPSLRPTMKKVVQMLEGLVEVPAPPCPSPYSRAV